MILADFDYVLSILVRRMLYRCHNSELQIRHLHMKTLLKYMFLAASIAAFAGMANATPTLWITDGTAANSFQVADGSLLDSNPGAGVVTYIGSVGIWTVNVSTGIVGGTTAQPTMDLNSVDVSTGAGTLYIYYSATGFGPSSGSLNVAASGTLAVEDSLTFQTGASGGNTLFSGIPITTEGPFHGPAISDTTSAAISFGSAFSLTELVTVSHPRTGGTTSFDMFVSVPDSGTTLLLLGAALTGLGLFGRLRKRVS
jgi:hypothetical protein